MKAADLPKARMPRAVLPKCGLPWCGWQVRKGSGGFEAATNDLLGSEAWTAPEETAATEQPTVAARSAKTVESTQEAIAYKKGMVLEAGKTYKQYGKNYLCTRGSENPVSGNLKDLTIYVEPIK